MTASFFDVLLCFPKRWNWKLRQKDLTMETATIERTGQSRTISPFTGKERFELGLVANAAETPTRLFGETGPG